MTETDFAYDIKKGFGNVQNNIKANNEYIADQIRNIPQKSMGDIFSKIDDIASRFVYDGSDSEDETVEEKPIRIRNMSFRTEKIYSRKPNKEQFQHIIDEDTIPVQPRKQETFVERPQIKPILVDRDSQCPKSHLSPTFNCPIQIIPEQVQKQVKTYNTQSTNTKETRKRNEATETEALLPQYESKLMELIQNILNEAPLCANSMPSEDELSDILLQFVNQVIRDADNLPQKPSQTSSATNAPSSVLTRGIGSADSVPPSNRTSYATQSIQSDAIDTIDNGTQTQGKISLRTLESKQNASFPPEQSRRPVLTIAAAGNEFTKPEQSDAALSQAKLDIFDFPPPLTSHSVHPDPVLTSKITSPIGSFVTDDKSTGASGKKKAQQNLQLETLVSKSVDVVPSEVPSGTRVRSIDNTDIPPKPSNVSNLEDNPPKPAPKKQQAPVITLQPLSRSIIQLPDDLGDISSLNISLDDNLPDSEDGELSSISGTSVSTYTTSTGDTGSTINTSTIERLLDSDSGSISQSGNSFNLNDMSSGEVVSSVIDSDEVSSSILNDS